MGASEKNIDINTSKVFTVLKTLSILMVLTGHFFKEYDLLWVPVTVGLIIFSFSSGYFTTVKYTGNFSRKSFWLKKFERLGINLLVINAFLLILFLFQGRDGIGTWHSLINVLGLNGFLNWFRIADPSPFGAGMWFFTLLMIFYLVFPFLNQLNRFACTVFTVSFIFSAFFLEQHIIYGHALWLTTCGFITGIWGGKNKLQLPFTLCLLSAVFLFMAMMGCNLVFHLKQFNFLFILFFSLASIYACLRVTVPGWVYKTALFFSGILFEIYLVHSYLFIKPTQVKGLDFLISIAVIVSVSKVLSLISSKIHSQLRSRV